MINIEENYPMLLYMFNTAESLLLFFLLPNDEVADVTLSPIAYLATIVDFSFPFLKLTRIYSLLEYKDQTPVDWGVCIYIEYIYPLRGGETTNAIGNW